MKKIWIIGMSLLCVACEDNRLTKTEQEPTLETTINHLKDQSEKKSDEVAQQYKSP